MRKRFFALRLISGIYKSLAVLALIVMVFLIGYVLIDATAFPTIDSKLPVVAVAVATAILLPLILWGLAQLFDVMIATELNTRSAAKLLQRLGKLMEERL
jgi:hypothetical protein